MSDFIENVRDNITISKVIIGVVVIITLIFVFVTYSGYASVNSQYESTMSNLSYQIEDANKQLEQVNNQTGVESEVVTTSITNATELGNKVAELQTKYSELDATIQSDAFKQNANSLKECFYDESGVSDWQTPWFGYGDKKLTWQFKTTYGYTVNSTNTINVLWECCQEGNSDMVAYAMGVYDGEQKKFTNIKSYITDAGYKVVNTATDDNSSNTSSSLKDEIDNMVERMKELDGNTNAK